MIEGCAGGAPGSHLRQWRDSVVLLGSSRWFRPGREGRYTRLYRPCGERRRPRNEAIQPYFASALSPGRHTSSCRSRTARRCRLGSPLGTIRADLQPSFRFLASASLVPQKGVPAWPPPALFRPKAPPRCPSWRPALPPCRAGRACGEGKKLRRDQSIDRMIGPRRTAGPFPDGSEHPAARGGPAGIGGPEPAGPGAGRRVRARRTCGCRREARRPFAVRSAAASERPGRRRSRHECIHCAVVRQEYCPIITVILP